MPGVAADVVTGFLGSGKTTLLKHVLDRGLDGRRVAVIMNELGEIGIDGRVITGLAAVERMVELNSGCICCSIGAQFGLAVREILATVQPHLVVIETTGIAEPEALLLQVQDAGLALDAVITMVDAESGPRILGERREARAQVESADFLVVNKTDLAPERGIRALERRLSRMNPRALLRRTAFGRLGDSDVLFGTSVGRLRRQADSCGRSGAEGGGGSGHMDAPDAIEAFNWRSRPGENFLPERLRRFLAHLPADLYRAKGIVRLAGREDPVLFHLTCGRIGLEAFPGRVPAGTESQAVFIGRQVRRHAERITAGLDRCRPGRSRLDRLRAVFGGRS